MPIPNIHSILFIFFLLLHALDAAAQKNECCKNEIIPAIEETRQAESGEMDFVDTLQRSVRLIFEKQFNDSIIIMLDSSIIYNAMLVTSTPGAPRAKIIDVDYSKIKKTPRIAIRKANGECMWFYLQPGYRVAYINYVKQVKGWIVELSNIQRQYI